MQCSPCAEVLVGENGSSGVDQPADEDELHAEVEEEVATVAQLPTYSPSRSEIEEHNVTRTPYRPWCKFCNEGRGQEHGHHRRKGVDPNRVPLVCFDYKPLSDVGDVGGLKYDPEDESTTCVLVVAIRTSDDRQSCVFGHLVPAKGVDIDKFSVDFIVGDILWTGYTKVLLKSDNEPAIFKLLVEALRELRVNGLEQVLSDNSPEYDPQANGAAESAVKSWKGMCYTHKAALEARLGMKIPVRHPLTAWLAKWSGEVQSWDVKGQEGLTPYYRIRGKPFRTRLLTLAESCRYTVSEP